MADKKYSITAILGVDSAALSKGLTKAGKAIKDWAKKMDTAIRGAVTKGVKVAGAAVAGFTAASLKEFASFEKGMNEVFTLLPGISEEAMGKMESDVLKLAKEMGVLPEEIVPALYQSLSAGVPPENVFEFLGTAVKGSKAGVAETAEAVDALSSVVNAYGKETLSAKEASDIMFTTIKLGKTTYTELSASLFNVAPAAAAAGVSFEDVSAAIAALTAQGVPTRVATTQIRQAILSMMAPNKQMYEGFLGTGHAAADLAEIMKEPGGLIKAMQLVEKTANGNMTVMKGMYGSVEALQGVLALTSQEGKKFNDTLEEIQNGAGATDTAFQQMDQGLARAFEKMKANLKAAMISFGKALMPLLEKVLPLIEELMQKFANIDWGNAFEKLAALWNEYAQPTFEKFVAAVKAMPWEQLAEQAGIFFTVLATTVKQVTELIIKVLPAVIPVIKAVMGWYQLLMLRITIIATVLGEVAEPIVAFISTIANAISGFFNLITNPSPEALQKFLETVMKSFKKLAEAIVGLLTKVGGLVKDVILGWFSGADPSGAAKALSDNFIGVLIRALKGSKETIVNFFSGLIDEIGAFFSGAGTKFAGASKSKLAEVLRGMLEQVKGMIDGIIELFDALGGIVSDAAELMGGMFSGIGESAGSTFTNIIDTAAAAYAKFYSMYLTVYEAIIKTVADLLKWARPLIKDLMAAYLGAVKAAVTGIISLIEPAWEAFSGVVDFIKETFMGVVERIAPAFKVVAFLILKYYTFVYNLVRMYIDVLVEYYKTALKIIKNTILPVLEVIRNVIFKLWDAIMKLVKAAVKAFLDAFEKSEGKTMTMIEVWEQKLLPAIKKGFAAVEKFLRRIAEGWKLLEPYLMQAIDILTTILIPVVKLLARTVATTFKTWYPIIEGMVKYVINAVKAVVGVIAPAIKFVWTTFKSVFDLIAAAWTIIVGIFTLDWDYIKAGFGMLWDIIGNIFKAGFDVIKGILNGIVLVVEGLWGIVWGILKGAWNAIKGMFTALYDFIYDILIGNSVTTVFKDCFDIVLGIIKAIFGVITKIIKAWFSMFKIGLELIRDIVKAVFGIIGKVIGKVIDGIVAIIQAWFDMVKAGLEFIQGVVEAVFGVIGDVVGAVFGTITAVAGAAFGVLKAGWEAVGAVAGAVWGGIKDAAGWAWDGITSIAETGQEILSAGWETAKNVAGSIWDGITGIVGGAWDGIKSIASKGQDLLKAGWEGAKSVASGAWNGIKSIAGSVWDDIKATDAAAQKFLKKGWEGAKKAAGGAWDWIKSKAGGAWDSITATAQSGVDALDRGWKTTKRAATNAWDGITGAAKSGYDSITGWFSSMKEKGSSLWESIKGAAGDAWDATKEGARSAAESAGLLEPEAKKGTEAIKEQAAAAEGTEEALTGAALEAHNVARELEGAKLEALALNETAGAFRIAAEGMTPFEMIAEAHEEQRRLNETALDHPFVKMVDAPKLELKMGGAIKPITSRLKSIDGTLKRIEKTVGKKFVNQ
jgi:TP901 family phage tail tape measure protein